MFDCFHDITPIEEYRIDSYPVLVKREDMFGSLPAPPLAKLRGASKLLLRLKREGITRVAIFDTRVSKSGLGVAYICRELGMDTLVGFPRGKYFDTKNEEALQSLGAETLPIKAALNSISYREFRDKAISRGYYILPQGLVCQEAVEEVSKVAATLPEVATVVVCTGTGTIATGIALGCNAKIIGISCGMNISKQYARMRQLCWPRALPDIELLDSGYSYYDKGEVEPPFPSHPYYDYKAWEWLYKNISYLKQPVLLWNIGA